MFGPLSFEESINQTVCLLCEDRFDLKSSLPDFLKHAFEVHSLIIEDPQNIDNLHEYIQYWKNKFVAVPIEEIIPSIVVTSDQKYHVLSILMKEDKQLRHKLKLERMLNVQETERNDENFCRYCLFCRLNFKGKRADFLYHLGNDHNLRLGNPQNLVYVDELLDRIERKLEALECLYCEKTFPDRIVLKEHMRKKQHKHINPGNHVYDKYYAINYLDPDRDWQRIGKEVDGAVPYLGNSGNTDQEYDDWNEPEMSINCLFCPLKLTQIDRLCLHMNSKHRFNFYTLTRHLNFYQKLKLINYVRRQINNFRCIYCDAKFANGTDLDLHMEKQKHHCLPDTKVFDQPEFYFSTYENDSFLYFLDDIDD